VNISEHGAFAFSMAAAGFQKPKPEFDRSKIFMICIQNYEDFRRLSVTMIGGARFEVDSRTFPYDIDMAADWLAGGE